MSSKDKDTKKEKAPVQKNTLFGMWGQKPPAPAAPPPPTGPSPAKKGKSLVVMESKAETAQRKESERATHMKEVEEKAEAAAKAKVMEEEAEEAAEAEEEWVEAEEKGKPRLASEDDEGDDLLSDLLGGGRGGGGWGEQ